MSAVVLPFIGSNSERKITSKICEVTELSLLKKRRLENLVFESSLLEEFKGGFLTDEVCIYEEDFLETRMEQNESPLNSNRSELAVIGIFSSFYGTFNLDLLCTGKGYIDFCYCFNTPDIEKCKYDFPKEHFKLSFGDTSYSMRQFEDYLKKFIFIGEIHKSSTLDYSAELRSLRNPYCDETFKGYNIKVVEPMLISSIKNYFKLFEVDC